MNQSFVWFLFLLLFYQKKVSEIQYLHLEKLFRRLIKREKNILPQLRMDKCFYNYWNSPAADFESA